MRRAVLAAVMWVAVIAAEAADEPGVIRRQAWSFDRSQLDWCSWAKPDEEKAKGTLNAVAGWAEYDFEVPADGWYELKVWCVAGWTRDLFIDGELLFYQMVSVKEDNLPGRNAGTKEANLWLAQGKHTLKYRRTAFPPCLPTRWELVPANGRPEASVRAFGLVQNIQPAGTAIPLRFLGGRPGEATRYELAVVDLNDGSATPAGTLEFPAAAKPVVAETRVQFPRQGQFVLTATCGDRTLRPADLKAGRFVSIDVKNPPAPAATLRTTPLIDIDCVQNTLNGSPVELGRDYFENRCRTAVVTRGGLTYRESTPTGELPASKSEHWGCEAFAYRFALPDKDPLYRVLVDYPDDERRTMGFPVRDFPKQRVASFTSTGGVETGDHYPLSHQVLTHESYFYCNAPETMVAAVVNQYVGGKAAAVRIRVERVDGELPAAPAGAANGRAMGFYFEEGGRWHSYFGGWNGRDDSDLAPHIETAERWARWNRYIGANLMFPTVMVYNGIDWPSRAAAGWGVTRSENLPRILGLVADKYGQLIVPEIHVSGSVYFEKDQFGLYAKDGKLQVMTPGADEVVLRDGGGNTAVSWRPYAYNALHPKVQAKYLELVGELADMLADCRSFAGVSSRLMPSWQAAGFNILPGLKMGYDDWSVAQFEQDTGIKVPGAQDDPKRFQKRFDFLTNQERERWLAWRCQRLFDYHRRLLARIRQAKPEARLFMTYFGPDDACSLATDTLGQMREMGIDPRLYASEEGIVIVPGGSYGRRFSTPAGDAGALDPALYDPQTNEVALCGGRGRYLYMSYFEYGYDAEFEKLGGSRSFINDSCTPPGVQERELYAMCLANSDSSFIVNGGAGWIFGTPAVMQPFLREYRALPARRFEPWDQARDPVAVWFRKEGGTLYFYAVNRLPVPVEVDLGLSGWFVGVKALADGTAVPQRDGAIRFALAPYMLKSFVASGKGTLGLQRFACRVPPEFVAKVAPVAQFAQQFAAALSARQVCPELTAEEAGAAAADLAAAAAAFAKGEYWRAWRVDSFPLVGAYSRAGRFPPGMWDRSVPHGLVEAPGAPRLAAPGEAGIWGDTRGRLASCTGLGPAPDGGFWASSATQLMQFDAAGKYLRSLPISRPGSAGIGGDARRYRLPFPERFEEMKGAALADGRPGGRDWSTPLYLFDPRDGRPLAEPVPMGPFAPGAFLANGPGGAVAVSSDASGVRTVRKLGPGPAGRLVSLGDLRSWNAVAGAADTAGRLYLSLAGGGIKVLAPDGSEQDGPGGKAKYAALAVTPDGATLFAAAGSSVQSFRTGADGQFAAGPAADLKADVEALLLLPNGLLVAGLKRAAPDGAVVLLLRLQPAALERVGVAVQCLGGIADQCLDGYTQLQEWQGGLCYLAHRKVWRLEPGAAKATLLCDPQPGGAGIGFEAFAIAPGGDVYLSSHWAGSGRGLNLYRVRKGDSGYGKLEYLNGGKPLVANPYFVNTAMTVARDGDLYLRLLDGSGQAAIHKWSPATGASTAVWPAKDRNSGYGLELQPDGGLLIGGGSARSLARLAPDGAPLWSWQYDTHYTPGTRDARQPSGLSLDSRGRTWVVDSARSVLMCLDRDGRLLSVSGHAGGLDDRSGLGMWMPAGVKAIRDAGGVEWLYVADVGNQRLLRYRLP